MPSSNNEQTEIHFIHLSDAAEFFKQGFNL